MSASTGDDLWFHRADEEVRILNERVAKLQDLTHRKAEEEAKLKSKRGPIQESQVSLRSALEDADEDVRQAAEQIREAQAKMQAAQEKFKQLEQDIRQADDEIEGLEEEMPGLPSPCSPARSPSVLGETSVHPERNRMAATSKSSETVHVSLPPRITMRWAGQPPERVGDRQAQQCATRTGRRPRLRRRRIARSYGSSPTLPRSSRC